MSNELDEEGPIERADVLHFGRDQGRGSGCLITPLRIICAASVFLVVSSIVPLFIRARAQGRLTACKSNLKNLGTACEMYSTDWAGKYPRNLELLTPKYLKTLPECNVAGTFTYRYQTGTGAAYNTKGFEDYYFIYCHGQHHRSTGFPDNYPQYDGIQGLIDR